MIVELLYSTHPRNSPSLTRFSEFQKTLRETISNMMFCSVNVLQDTPLDSFNVVTSLMGDLDLEVSFVEKEREREREREREIENERNSRLD